MCTLERVHSNLRFLSVASTYGKAIPLSAEATIRMSIQRAIMQVLFVAIAVQVVIFGVSCCVFTSCHSRVHNNKAPEISMTVSLLQEYLADCCDTSARKSHFHVRPREGSLNLRFLSVASTYGKAIPLSAEATIRMSIQRAIMQVLFLAVAVQVVIFGVSSLLCFTSATPESVNNKAPEISMTVSMLQEYLADCCDTSARKSHFHVRPREGSLNLRFLSVASTYGKAKPLSAEATICMSIQRAIMQVLFLAVAVQVVICAVSSLLCFRVCHSRVHNNQAPEIYAYELVARVCCRLLRHIGPQVSLSCAPSRGFTQPAVPKCGKHLWKGHTALRRGDDPHEHSESNHASAFPGDCCPSCDI